jgi:hypothetical protein
MKASERERDQSALESLYALEGKARLEKIEALIGAFIRGPARILAANLEEHKALADYAQRGGANYPNERIQQCLDLIEETIRDSALDSLTSKALEEMEDG